MKTKKAEETALEQDTPTPDVLEEPAAAVPPFEPTPPAPERRTAEQWAEAAGMLPQFRPVAAPFAPAGAAQMLDHNPSFWRFAATRAGMGWPIGKELTKAEFDAAVETAMNHTYR
jgi:hypothetical protein